MIGYKVYRIEGISFRENQKVLMPITPLSKSELKRINLEVARSTLKSSNVYLIRWEERFDELYASEWWHVIKEKFDDLEKLPKKTRYYIRKADKEYYTSKVPRERILELGYSVYSSAYKRYDTHERKYTFSQFRKAVQELPAHTEFWGVFSKNDDSLVAFSENYVDNDVCFYVTMWASPEALKTFAGYLLFHDMERYYLYECGLRFVSDGARSLSHATNIHEFLIKKFNFRKAYCSLNVVYKPTLGFLVRILFPFRNLLNRVPIAIFKKVYVILRQEEIHRACN